MREPTKAKGDDFGGKCQINRICVVAVNKEGKYLSAGVKLKEKSSDATVEAKRFFYGDIKGIDLPQTKNEEKEILDVALFYRDEGKFMQMTVANAVERIVR